jgi:hypothetical protein
MSSTGRCRDINLRVGGRGICVKKCRKMRDDKNFCGGVCAAIGICSGRGKFEIKWRVRKGMRCDKKKKKNFIWSSEG